jgi:hypothetical protein
MPCIYKIAAGLTQQSAPHFVWPARRLESQSRTRALRPGP